jgi:ubiquinone/menaquinone biosynthesis C-methylase UbiE
MRGLYDRFVVPQLVHWGMRSERLQGFRAATVAAARGRVLEIGIGSGLNFPFYGREVTEVVGIDPAQSLLNRAAKAGGWMPFRIRLICQSAEHLPYPDQSFDSVVTTWSLCSIPDVEAALGEAYRVLKPGGRLVFIEHGAADTVRLQHWQRRLTPAWRCVAGGCHLDRRPDRLIAAAGFTLETLETGHLFEGPRLVTFHYRGIAHR